MFFVWTSLIGALVLIALYTLFMLWWSYSEGERAGVLHACAEVRGKVAKLRQQRERWAAELATQEAELGVFFDTVIVCSVTGSTQAGMVAGFLADRAAGGRERRVIGIDAILRQRRVQAGEKIAPAVVRGDFAIGGHRTCPLSARDAA
jgi:hypothetical protein